MDTKTYELYYQESVKSFFQGTTYDLNKRLKRTGEKVVSGSNGSWYLSRPAVRFIYEIINGETTRRACPDYYLHNNRNSEDQRNYQSSVDHVQRITRRACERLVDELRAGTLDFSELL